MTATTVSTRSTASAALAHSDRSMACGGCGAALVVDADVRTLTCPFCASPAVVERPPNAHRAEPAFAIGFSKNATLAHDAFAAWKKSRNIFCHSGIKRASVEKLKGVYIPAYLYSGVARSQYSAEIGENYTETYTTTVNGKTVTRTRTRTEWRHLSGTHVAYATDVVVAGSKSIENEELERVEPFDFRDLRKYAPGLIAGWLAEEATRSAEEGKALAREEVKASTEAKLNKFMPGDSHKNLNFTTTLDQEATDLILVPLWILAVKYDANKPALRVLVNGQTGKVGGKAPLSAIKITLAVVVGLAVVAGIIGAVLWLQRH